MKAISRCMSATLLVTCTLVLLSSAALGFTRPEWYLCYIDGDPVDFNDDFDCPSFELDDDVTGYFASNLGDDVDDIYWRIVGYQSSDWKDADTFYSAGSWQYYFEFNVDFDPTGKDRLEVWADGTTDYYGHCNI